MSIVVAWIAFPLVLLALATGCGLLLERLAGVRLPGAALAGTGLAVLIVAGQLATLHPWVADAATPLAVALAAAGFWLGGAARLRGADRWAALAAIAVVAVYAAPIVLGGAATFAGYARLDDTATWMALTDRIVEHGRSLDGLAPSTYEATLAFNLADGYPIGAFIPLGVGRALVGQDVAWVIQPYMAVLAAMLALALWSLASPLVADRRLRAGVAFVAAQPALLFGYYLWGGVKEVVAAALVATAATLVAAAVRERFSTRSLAPPAAVAAAVVAALSPAGAIWLVPLVVALAALGVREVGAAALARRAAIPFGLAVALSAPALAGGLLPPTTSSLTAPDARGALLEALHPAQAVGIWPAGDFRFEPDQGVAAAVLIGLAAAAACGGTALAWWRRAWPLLAFAACSLLAGGALVVVGSPWVGGKALATASPAIPLLAAVAAATLIADGRRIAGPALGLALVLGVLWSNALAYREVNLAPRAQLAELQEIGGRIAGQGPTLITEYQPYGARHFLRSADPEGASELRRRMVPLRGGGTAATGEWVDTDELRTGGVLVYRTLVLRRNPSQSRPPSPYKLASRGRYYDVWQRRAAGGEAPVERLPLGEGVDPAGRPSCGRVRELAERVGEGGALIAAPPRRLVVAPLAPGHYPRAWYRRGRPERPLPGTAGALTPSIRVPAAGGYEVWLGGSVRPRVELWIDGRLAGSARHELNHGGQYVRLGAADLDRGEHEIEVRFIGADLGPGSGGAPDPIGPLALEAAEPRSAPLVRVDPEEAASFCGRRWDWIEAVR